MQKIKKLAIISTHPIQYYAPVFKLLHERKQVEINVFYTWGEGSSNKHDPGFGKHVEWDLPLFEGYRFEWVENTSADPGSHHFGGIKNPGLIRQITDWNPDAVLVFGWGYQSHLTLLRHFSGKLPVYFRGDSTLLDETGGIKHLFKTWFLKWVYSHVDHVFYVGMANKKYFQKYGIKDAQLSFTPHAVDNDRFGEDRSSEAQELRLELGLHEESILILFAGKFEPKKNPHLLLDAFLKLDNPNVHLLFAGNGPLEASLKSQLSRLNTQDVRLNAHASTPLSMTTASTPLGMTIASTPLSMTIASTPLSMTERIHFIDFQNQTQMPVLYQACDLFCLPSKGPGESWGLAINEAMACGKAVLASDKVGSAYDLVKEGGNGLIFKSGNETDLKEKLEHLASGKIDVREYGRRSKEMIKEWNFGAIASGIERILKNEPQG